MPQRFSSGLQATGVSARHEPLAEEPPPLALAKTKVGNRRGGPPSQLPRTPAHNVWPAPHGARTLAAQGRGRISGRWDVGGAVPRTRGLQLALLTLGARHLIVCESPREGMSSGSCEALREARHALCGRRWRFSGGGKSELGPRPSSLVPCSPRARPGLPASPRDRRTISLVQKQASKSSAIPNTGKAQCGSGHTSGRGSGRVPQVLTRCVSIRLPFEVEGQGRPGTMSFSR